MKSKHDVDCGWAWVVLAAACLERFLGSIAFLSGIYYVAFLETFKQSPNLIAWCTALHLSMPSLIGPVASGVVSVLGARRTTFLGAFMMVSGFFTSAFVSSSVWLLISYGIIAGGGSGLTYVPAFIALGYSFDKYRKIAYAISCTSVGLGTMVFASLIQLFIDEYGWQGSMIITAGIMAHLFVIGAVYRPVDVTNNLDNNLNYSTETLHDDDLRRKPPNIYVDASNKTNLFVDINTQSGDCNRLYDKYSIFKSHNDISRYNTEINKHKFNKDLDGGISRSQPDITVTNTQCRAIIYDTKPVCLPRKDFLLMGTFSKASSELIFQSSIYLDKRDKQNLDVLTLQNVHISTKNATKETDKTKTANIFEKYHAIIHWRFCIYTLTVILFHIGMACTYVHYPIFLVSNNISSELTSKLMSSIGIASIISRVLTGFAANSNDINITVLFMASGGLTGIVLCLAPVIGSNFYGQLLVCIGFGIYSNCMPPLLGPMTIELVGLHLLNVAYGIQLFLMAVGMVIGPPLVGIAFDFTGTYNWSMITAGLAYLFGALLMMCVPLGKQNVPLNSKQLTQADI